MSRTAEHGAAIPALELRRAGRDAFGEMSCGACTVAVRQSCGVQKRRKTWPRRLGSLAHNSGLGSQIDDPSSCVLKSIGIEDTQN